MPTISDPLPEWFPLRIYDMNLSPSEWAIQIENRINFQEIYITRTDPKWQDEKKSKFLESDCKDLSATWKRWFVSTADPYNEDSSIVRNLSRTDKQMRSYHMLEVAYGAEKPSKAVEFIEDTKALRHVAELSENQERLTSDLQETVSSYKESLSDLSKGEKQKKLDILERMSLDLYLAILLECSYENAGIPKVFPQLNHYSKQIWIGINPEFDNDAILAELRQKLPIIRDYRENCYKITQEELKELRSELPILRSKIHSHERITPKELEKWKSYGILQIFDLEMWASINKLHFTDIKIAKAACENKKSALRVGHFRDTARPYAYKIITRETVSRLKNTII